MQIKINIKKYQYFNARVTKCHDSFCIHLVSVRPLRLSDNFLFLNLLIINHLITL